MIDERLVQHSCRDPNPGLRRTLTIVAFAGCIPLGLVFAQTRPLPQSPETQNAPPQAEAAEEKTAVHEDKIMLRLVDPNGRPVVGAKAAAFESVRVCEIPVLGSKLEWFRATSTSDGDGRVVLEMKDLFPGQLNEAPVYILHEERRIGAIHQVLRGKTSEESPIVLGPVCHVHGTLDSAGLTAIGMPLQWTEIEVLHAHLFTLLRCSFNPRKHGFEFPLPPGEYLLWNSYGWGGKGDDLPGIIAGTEYNKNLPITIARGQSDLDMGVIDLRPTKLSTMTGSPAPEIGPMKAWKNGAAVTLASLRGQMVWLHFAGDNPGLLTALPTLLEIHRALGDKGLTIIAIFNCASMEELDRKWSDAYKQFGGAAEVPFRIAIDGGESTVYEGSNVERRGATYGRYAIPGYPKDVLIDAEGNIVGQLQPSRAKETISQMLALRQEPLPPGWRQRFNEVYRLADGEVLKWIAPPFIAERMAYGRTQPSRQVEAIPRGPEQIIFHWDGQLKNWHMSFGRVQGFDSILSAVLRLKSHEYDAPRSLLDWELPGDWIIRDEAPQQVKLRALEELVARELGRKIHFEKRSVEREVLIVTGRFKFHPLAGARENTLIHLYTKDSDLDYWGTGGERADSLSQFLQTLGNQVNLPVIDRTEQIEPTRIPYRRHSSSYSVRRGRDEQERARQLRVLLDHLTAQTELHFEVRTEPVEVWFVTE